MTENTELYPRHSIDQIGHVGTVLEELIGAEALAKIELRVVVHSITSPTRADILYSMGAVEVRIPLDGAGIKNARRSHLRAVKASTLNVAIMSAMVDIDKAAAAASAAESAASATEAAASATEAAASATEAAASCALTEANAAAAQDAARYVDEVKEQLTELARAVSVDRQATAENANAAQAAAAEAKQAAAMAQVLFRALQPLERYQALLDGTYSLEVVKDVLAATAAAASTASASTSTACATSASTSTAAPPRQPHTTGRVCHLPGGMRLPGQHVPSGALARNAAHRVPLVRARRAQCERRRLERRPSAQWRVEPHRGALSNVHGGRRSSRRLCSRGGCRRWREASHLHRPLCVHGCRGTMCFLQNRGVGGGDAHSRAQ